MTPKRLEFKTDDEHSRKMMLEFLDAVEVSWPHEVKLSTAVVRKRLSQALDYAQTWDVISKGEHKIDLSIFNEWELLHPEVTIRHAVKRFSLGEDPRIPLPIGISAKRMGKEDDPSLLLGDKLTSVLTEWPPKVNHLVSMQRISYMLAALREKREGLAIFITPSSNMATILSTDNVFSVSAKDEEDRYQYIPLFQVQVEFHDKPLLQPKGSNVIKYCTMEEHIALRVLLCQNNARIESPRGVNGKNEIRKTSFWAPIGPLTSQQLGNISGKPGCAVCGEENTRKCGRCGQANYCGEKCQKSHWVTHKEYCAPVNNSEWHILHRGKSPGYQAVLNKRDQQLRPEKRPSTYPLKDFSHPIGSPFIIKVQVNAELSMLIYDRKRELQWQFFLNGMMGGNTSGEVDKYSGVNDDVFPKIVDVCRRKGWNGIKVFMWAKKVSEDEISVCLDPLPSQKITW